MTIAVVVDIVVVAAVVDTYVVDAAVGVAVVGDDGDNVVVVDGKLHCCSQVPLVQKGANELVECQNHLQIEPETRCQGHQNEALIQPRP